jgi:hypothetical protein
MIIWAFWLIGMWRLCQHISNVHFYVLIFFIQLMLQARLTKKLSLSCGLFWWYVGMMGSKPSGLFPLTGCVILGKSLELLSLYILTCMGIAGKFWINDLVSCICIYNSVNQIVYLCFHGYLKIFKSFIFLDSIK